MMCAMSESPVTEAPQRQVLLIGIGAGDPGFLTLQAADAIKQLDVLFIVPKEHALPELVEAHRALVDHVRGDADDYRVVELTEPERPWSESPRYQEVVDDWRQRREEVWASAIERELQPGQRGAFLSWGDPSVYESTLTNLREIDERGLADFSFEVLPGISSIHALTARHRISLNRQGQAVRITPARLLANGLPPGIDDIVVLHDSDAVFAKLQSDRVVIYWGAYLGTADELLISGPLSEVREQIATTRAEALERKGWILDAYLLRRFSHERRERERDRRQLDEEPPGGQERRSGRDRRFFADDLPPMPAPTPDAA